MARTTTYKTTAHVTIDGMEYEVTGEVDYYPGNWGSSMADAEPPYIEDIRIDSVTTMDEDGNDILLSDEQISDQYDRFANALEVSDWETE